MLVPNSLFDGLPIIDLQMGQIIAELKGPIIDPNELKIVAFYCRGQFIDKGSVLHIEDIREYSHEGIAIDNQESIMPLNAELVRLEEIVGINFQMIDKLVVDDHETKLGKIESYATDIDSFLIKQFRVSRSIFRSWQDASLLINRQQIIEITDKYIVVKAPDIRAKSASQSGWIPQILTRS